MKQPKVLQGTGKTAGLALAASFLYFIACGIRNNFGVMLAGIIENTGMAFASASFAMA